MEALIVFEPEPQRAERRFLRNLAVGFAVDDGVVGYDFPADVVVADHDLLDGHGRIALGNLEDLN